MPYFSDVVHVFPLGAKARVHDDYLQWRASVLTITHMPEYKLKRLWKENFTVEDIKACKHWEIYPRSNPAYKYPGPKPLPKGRAMSIEQIELAGLRAMRDEIKKRMRIQRLSRPVFEQSTVIVNRIQKRIDALRGFDVEGVAYNEETSDQQRSKGENGSYLDLWFEHVLAQGKLPCNPVPAKLLLQMARENTPQLCDLTAAWCGRYLRQQGLMKFHTDKGNSWRFDSLAECRRMWEAVHGMTQWPNDLQEWQIGA